MTRTLHIKKGLNIHLPGEAEKVIHPLPLPQTFAIKPPDFLYVVPKLLVKPGDEVMAGTSLFYDKNNPSVKFCAPVSGEVAEIIRGDKRRILEIVILADNRQAHVDFGATDPVTLSREAILEKLLNSGAFPCIRQRPYHTIPNPQDVPKAIFISGFDTHPLAPDLDFVMQHFAEDFQTGLNVLRPLTFGKVHLSLRADGAADIFEKADGVEIHRISGPHPAGNVGVQIHHFDPISKGESVWCLHAQDVATIGRLFRTGHYAPEKIVAVAGAQLQQPQYYKTRTGTSVKNMLEASAMKEGRCRIISGNVLTGESIAHEGYLGFYHNEVTVIPEGDEPEFMGWISPGLQKFSMSRAYFSWLQPNKTYNLDTNTHGEERPFVMTGQYEKVFPMDIFPVQLLKAAMIEDIELMENLGIYEVVEEDFALCEFVCTSKIESQKIIRRGLDLVRKEMG